MMTVEYSSADGRIEPSNTDHPLVKRSYELREQVNAILGGVSEEVSLAGAYREAFMDRYGKIDWERVYQKRIANYEDLLGISSRRMMEDGAAEYEEIMAAQELYDAG